jgi:hypothetical protein
MSPGAAELVLQHKEIAAPNHRGIPEIPTWVANRNYKMEAAALD